MAAAKLPFKVQSDPFEKYVRGVFGRFKTNTSYALNFIMTSVTVPQARDDLQTAAEAFRIEDIDFAQMIQRDIDYDRVKRIATDYLEQGEGRVIFFPPLLVSLVVVTPDGTMKERYASTTEEMADGLFRQVWDADKFKIELPIADSTYPRSLQYKGQRHSYYEFGAELRYNPRSVKLVVIDGQHRLEAIRLLARAEDKRVVVSEIEVPVCIVFPPDATIGKAEVITKDLRQLFVTVNTESKKVSGHFIVLLRDDSLAANTVRALADSWKAQSISGLSVLHLLEWNQRDDSRVAQRTRKYSLTTISIIFDALKEHLFDDQLGSTFLNLSVREPDLEAAAPGVDWSQVEDSHYDERHLRIFDEQIRQELVPALDLLFRKPRPYADVEIRFKSAVDKLNDKIAGNNTAFQELKERLAKHLFSFGEIETTATQNAFREFEEWIVEKPEDAVFRYNVFQQGLLRAWIRVSSDLVRYEIHPRESASIIIAGLSPLCFKENRDVFAQARTYTRRVLYRGDRIVLTSAAKDAWSNLILGTLVHNAAGKAYMGEVARIKPDLDEQLVAEIREGMQQMAGECVGAFLGRFKEEARRDIEKNYADQGYARGLVNQLRRLQVSRKPSEREAFKSEVQKLAEEKLEEAKKVLANVLEIKTDELDQYLT